MVSIPLQTTQYIYLPFLTDVLGSFLVPLHHMDAMPPLSLEASHPVTSHWRGKGLILNHFGLEKAHYRSVIECDGESIGTR
jgi:hypothetical protein